MPQPDDDARERDRRFRASFEHAAVGIAHLTVEGRFVRFNPKFCDISGYSPGQLEELRLHDITHSEDLPRELGLIERLARGELPSFTLEKRFVRADGAETWVNLTSSPVRDPAGRVEYVIAIVEDIDGRRRAAASERGAVAQRDRLIRQQELLLRRMPVACVTADVDGHTTFWNAAAEKLFGFSADEALGRSLRDICVPPDARPYVDGVADRLRAGDLNAHGLNENVTKDGRRILCEWHNTPVLDDEGRYAGIISMVQDVTEREQGQRALRDERDYLNAILQTSVAAILVADEAGRFTTANQATERLMELPAREITARSFNDPAWRITGEDGARIPDEQLPFARVLATRGPVFDVEHTIERPDGTRRLLSVNGAPLLDDRGEVRRVVFALRDVTDRRTLEKQYQQAQKMEAVGRLAGGVAHDFNNILTVIQSCGLFLHDALHAADPLRADVDEILRSAERAAKLTRQLLAFSRKSISEPRVLSLAVVIVDLKRMLDRIVGEDVELRVQSDPDLWPIRADVPQLEQVLTNLVVNARDAMPDGGILAIEARNVVIRDGQGPAPHLVPPGSYVKLAVTDDGVGMPADVQERIFEPFFTTKKENGTGLGLATVYGIVKQSGGYVTVHSELGRGTTFHLFFPRTQEAEPARVAAHRVTAIDGNGRVVLLVEDEHSLRRMTRRMLESQGFQVAEAANAGEALLIATQRDRRIDLVLTDVVMPRVNGRQLVEQLRELRPGLPAVFMSGYTDNVIVHRGVLDDGLIFLAKPFTRDDLAAKLRSAVG